MIVPIRVFALRAMCKTNSSRYSLGGVRFSRIEPGTARAEVTDGSFLAVAQWREPDPGEPHEVLRTAAGVEAKSDDSIAPIVPRSLLDQAAQAFPCRCREIVMQPRLRRVLLEQSADQTTVAIAGSPDGTATARVEASEIDGRFPDVQSICRQALWEDYTSICVDARKLATLAQTAAELLRTFDGNEAVPVILSVPKLAERAGHDDGVADVSRMVLISRQAVPGSPDLISFMGVLCNLSRGEGPQVVQAWHQAYEVSHAQTT